MFHFFLKDLQHFLLATLGQHLLASYLLFLSQVPQHFLSIQHSRILTFHQYLLKKPLVVFTLLITSIVYLENQICFFYKHSDNFPESLDTVNDPAAQCIKTARVHDH